jgi:hypothetical protein
VRRFPAADVLIETVRRSIGPLTGPIFCFWSISMVAGAALFFMEPCYVEGVCPFTDIFSGSYFSTVALTATGYGDQIPQVFWTRVIAVG